MASLSIKSCGGGGRGAIRPSFRLPTAVTDKIRCFRNCNGDAEDDTRARLPVGQPCGLFPSFSE